MTEQQKTPLTLQAIGSFYLTGKMVYQSGQPVKDVFFAPGGVPLKINPNGTQQSGQIYVQYFFPQPRQACFPLSFWHGGSLTGAMWEHTPDGRAGWLFYFLQHGWRIFNVDAVERGRSGWMPCDIHFAGLPILRTAEDSFTQFRIGASVTHASYDNLRQAAYPDCQFPLEHFADFMCQIVPRWTTTDELILSAYCQLLQRIGPVIIIAHSQGAAFALRAAARHPDKVAGLVCIEPAQTPGESALQPLNSVPILLVYGDNLHLDKRWPVIRQRTDIFFNKLQQHAGNVNVLDLPQHGIKGNSHMMMMERNSDVIAQHIENWLLKNIRTLL